MNKTDTNSWASMPSDVENLAPDTSGQSTEAAKRKFLEFLDNGGGEDFGLTYDKFTSRCGSIRPAEDHPGKFIVAVERHRAIAGCVYRPGLPMSAFETYQMRLLFNPASNELLDYDEISMARSIDVYALADEHARHEWTPRVLKREAWTSKRRVELQIACLVFESESLTDARAVLEKELRSLNHEMTFEYLDLSPEEYDDYLARYEDAFVEVALDGFDANWEDPELIEE